MDTRLRELIAQLDKLSEITKTTDIAFVKAAAFKDVFREKPVDRCETRARKRFPPGTSNREQKIAAFVKTCQERG